MFIEKRWGPSSETLDRVSCHDMAVGQNPVPLVNIKIAGTCSHYMGVYPPQKCRHRLPDNHSHIWPEPRIAPRAEALLDPAGLVLAKPVLAEGVGVQLAPAAEPNRIQRSRKTLGTPALSKS